MLVQNRMTNRKFNRITRGKRKSRIKPHVPKGKYVHIPELRMHIEVSSPDDLVKWVKEYCRKNPSSKELLYTKYGLSK